jgi:hypothetical protein
MYIEQAQKNLTDWWRYFIGLAIALAGVLVFSIPHWFYKNSRNL